MARKPKTDALRKHDDCTMGRAQAGALLLYKQELEHLKIYRGGLEALLKAGASFRMINPKHGAADMTDDLYNVPSIFAQINKVNKQMSMCQQRISGIEESLHLFVEGIMDGDFITHDGITIEESVVDGTVFMSSTGAF